MTARVLLVDDSRTIRLLVRAYLVGRNYEFIEMQDGITALHILRSDPPDLVLCDVFMPGMDGWSFVRAVRSDPRPAVRATPVILVSSKRGEDMLRQSVEAGANAFLSKPITGSRLIELINQLLAAATVQKKERHGPLGRAEEHADSSSESPAPAASRISGALPTRSGS